MQAAGWYAEHFIGEVNSKGESKPLPEQLKNVLNYDGGFQKG